MTVTNVLAPGLGARLAELISHGGRLALLTAMRGPDQGLALLAVVLRPTSPGRLAPEVWRSALDSDVLPPLSELAPQAAGAERALHDFFGLRPARGEPRSLVLHEAWPAGLHPLSGRPSEGRRTPYEFAHVAGSGVYEIPVGPIHAGIIEPGHFRFSCHGEVIHNLEIRLGYQHRGIEAQLARTPWPRMAFLVEAIASDTAAGHAMAHALAMESLLGVEPPAQAMRLRAVVLETERVACHLGDLNGLCADMGFALGAARFSLLRGRAQALSEWLTGSRYQAHCIVPGGVLRSLPSARRQAARALVADMAAGFEAAEPLLLDNAAALERMAGTGVVSAEAAQALGLVGPAGRASGSGYDVRAALAQAPWGESWPVAVGGDGDVLARATVRVEETRCSLALIGRLLDEYDDREPQRAALPDRLPAEATACGLAEGWRGEIVHLVVTDEQGGVARYAVKDPSLNNWPGLALAARDEVVSDFPLCNKSFGLSYSGHDL